MTDETDRRDGAPPARKPLTLTRTTSGGTVRQSFPHGRGKAVAVEVRQTRVVTRPGQAGPGGAAPGVPPQRPQTAKAAPAPAQSPKPAPAGGLSQAQIAARDEALRRARERAEQARAEQALADARHQELLAAKELADQAVEREQQQEKEQQEAERAAANAALAAAAQAADDARRHAEEAEAAAQPAPEPEPEPEPAPPPVATAPVRAAPKPGDATNIVLTRRPEGGRMQPPGARTAAAAGQTASVSPATKQQTAAQQQQTQQEQGQGAGANNGQAARNNGAQANATSQARTSAAPRPREPIPLLTPKVKPPKGEAGLKSRSKLTLDMVERMAEGDDERQRSLTSARKAREKEKARRMQGAQDQQRVVRDVIIPETITVQDLSARMATRAVDIIKYMFKQGTVATLSTVLDADTAQLVAEEHGHTVRRVSEADVEDGLSGDLDRDEDLEPRPPVVTVMGHVDHGKTSLLDALRQTDVASGEAGGITQHIGAYQVRLRDGQRVTFLDTPGHAAFSSMRARGAQVTDIVILVVAADDGVMPQTVEAIKHAKAAGVPMIVAVNKMDKPEANPQRVLNELLQHEVIAESLGGETQIVHVSATKKTGLDELVDNVLIQAEVLNLRANAKRPAEAVVIESKLERGRGAVATVLIKRGALNRGDIVVAGGVWGRVRAMSNERGQAVTTAGPAEPVEITGLEGAPDPGDMMQVVENEARAREVAEFRQRRRREKSSAPTGRVSFEQLIAKRDSGARELPVVIKSDVQGSAEAISGALEKLGNDEVRARVLQASVGGINESDVTLAKASGAPVIGFNVRASKEARDLAEREGVEIRYYAIIYDVIDDIKAVMSGMLAPMQRETFLGTAEILEVFQIARIGRVAGCRVTEGKMQRGAGVRLLRDNVVIHEGGKLNTLKRFKDDVNEAQTGQECGMSFENYQDVKQGDVVECFQVETVKRSL
jgi:translation initiation factor IF-2